MLRGGRPRRNRPVDSPARFAAAILVAALSASALAGRDSPKSAQAMVPQTKPTTTPDDLFRAVALQDAALFDAYNHCDLEKFAAFFADDVEFYHDHGGVTRGSKALTESVRKNICGKTTRELVPESLEVYPMDNYGAIEIGVHRFHHPGAPDEPVGEGRFVHLWQYDKSNGSWKVTRVLSFDHHALK
jgi:ketosteroid isomerase-like protein